MNVFLAFDKLLLASIKRLPGVEELVKKKFGKGV
jgi:hypothetical protein